MGGIFSGAKGMKLSESGVFFTAPFKGEVRVDRVVHKQGRKGVFYIVEATVVSVAQSATNPKTGKYTDNVGDKRSWVQSLKDQDVGFRAVKQFCLAASGIDSKSSDDAERAKEFENECEDIMSSSCTDGIFNGAVLPLEVIEIITKEKKQPFALHMWGPANPAEPEAETKAA